MKVHREGQSLRISVSLQGNVIEQRYLFPGSEYSVGEAESNSFSMELSGLPHSFPLVLFRNQRFYLHLRSDMLGALTLCSELHWEVPTLVQQGRFQDDSIMVLSRESSAEHTYHLVPLTSHTFGDIQWGEFTFRFWSESNPAPAKAAPIRPDLRWGWMKPHPAWAAALVASFLLHVGGMVGGYFASPSPVLASLPKDLNVLPPAKEKSLSHSKQAWKGLPGHVSLIPRPVKRRVSLMGEWGKAKRSKRKKGRRRAKVKLRKRRRRWNRRRKKRKFGKRNQHGMARQRRNDSVTKQKSMVGQKSGASLLQFAIPTKNRKFPKLAIHLLPSEKKAITKHVEPSFGSAGEAKEEVGANKESQTKKGEDACTCKLLNRKPKLKVEWYSYWMPASWMSRRDNKVLMAVFGTSWCYWCGKMKSETFKDARFLSEAQHFVLLDVDASVKKSLARKHKIEAYPTILFFSPSGKRIKTIRGYWSAKRIVSLMKRLRKKPSL